MQPLQVSKDDCKTQGHLPGEPANVSASQLGEGRVGME